MTSTVVVGAGWAGLATAVELCRRGRTVTLLEAAATPGGRARSVEHEGRTLDNGQHLLLGAYRDTRALLQRLGVDETQVFARLPLELLMHDAAHGDLHLRAGWMPTRLHLAQALLGARGPTRGERWSSLIAAGRLSRPPPATHTVAQWLTATAQPQRLRRQVWEPLCLAALNTPPETASAMVFHRVLREALANAEQSALYIPSRPLGAILPEPALDFLRRHGADVRLGTRVNRLLVDGKQTGGVELRGGERIEAAEVVLACGPRAGARLLAPHDTLGEIAGRLQSLELLPIATLYLAFDGPARLAPPMQGLLDEPLQWVFDRSLCGESGLIAGVISGPGGHMTLDNDTLIETATRQLRRTFPAWGDVRTAWIVRERHATFAATPAAEALRPASRTPVRGLWLAGDHLATGLPATLEGAVRSGLECVVSIATGETPHDA